MTAASPVIALLADNYGAVRWPRPAIGREQLNKLLGRGVRNRDQGQIPPARVRYPSPGQIPQPGSDTPARVRYPHPRSWSICQARIDSDCRAGWEF